MISKIKKFWPIVLLVLGIIYIFVTNAKDVKIYPEFHYFEDWVQAEQKAWEIALKNNYEIKSASGDSMFPRYPERSILVLEPVPFNELEKGLGVVFLDKNGGVIHHRLSYKNNRGYWVARGDNNDFFDADQVT